VKTGLAVFRLPGKFTMQKGNLISHEDYLIQPDGYTIPFDSEQIHGISTALAEAQGVPLDEVLEKFHKALDEVDYVVGHNVVF